MCARVYILDACLLAARAISRQEYIHALTHTRTHQCASMIETTMKWVARSRLHAIDFIECYSRGLKTYQDDTGFIWCANRTGTSRTSTLVWTRVPQWIIHCRVCYSLRNSKHPTCLSCMYSGSSSFIHTLQDKYDVCFLELRVLK